MNKRRLIDTNFIVRHLVQDDEKLAKVAGKLFEACDRGEVTLVVLPEVLAECVFVLESFYRHARVDISKALSALISSPGVESAEAPIHLNALSRYADNKLHFVDCMLAAFAAAHQTPVATFDGDFRKFKDVTVKVD